MMNENTYMVDMRSIAGPSSIQQQQPHVTYTHPHHQNMGITMYAHPQSSHHHTQVEHKYPPQNIMMQHTNQPHQISYVHHHSLINLAHQVPPKQNPHPVAIVDAQTQRKARVPKARNKACAAKIVKMKPPPPSVIQIITPPVAPPPAEEKPQKKKGRKRKYAQSRQERKENMYKNLPYINSRNQEVKPKEFEDYDCKCPLRCRKRVSKEVRKQEFEAFYALGSYTAQNVFLLDRIKEINKKTKIPKIGKKKPKKKSPKNTKKKNFPKMSSKYKRNIQISSDDDSDADCKEGIVEEKKISKTNNSLPKPPVEEEVQIVEQKPTEVLMEDKKCFGQCSSDECPHRIPSINNIYEYQKSNNDTESVIVESTNFEIPENAIVISDQKNNFYQYKDLNMQPTHSEYLSTQDQQVPNVDNNICLTIQSSMPNEQNTLSVVQVACPTVQTSNIQITNPEELNAMSGNLQVGHMMDSGHNTQMTCVSIQPTQHIIYTSQHIPYSQHEIFYQTHNIQQENNCANQQIVCSTQQNIYHSQDPLSSQNSSVLIHTNTDAGPQESSKRKRKPFKTERKFTRIYYLKKNRVCREMFVKTLKISSGRVNTVLKKSRSGDGLYRKSGNQGGHNKLTEEQKMEVYNHISSMLQHMSHDPRTHILPDSKMQQKSPYSLKSIYKVYKSSRDIVKPVSFTSYSRIFYKEFNPKKQGVSQSHNLEGQNSEKIIVLQPISQQYTIPQANNINHATKSYSSNNTGQMISTGETTQQIIYPNGIPVHIQIIDNHNQVTDNRNQITSNDDISSTLENQPKKKGRKRKYGDLTRQERKYNMYRNLPYVNSRKQHVSPKQFEDFDCHCPLKCRQRVSPKERKKEFEGYYSLGSYIAQNMYLLDRVEECKKKRCYIKNRPAKRERNYSRLYKLSKVRVCREMFLKTLKISSVRVNTVLNKKRSGEELTYKRGLNQGGMNKITDDQKIAIVEHINTIIRSLSVNQQPNAEGDFVFPQEYTFKRMYEIYLENNNTAKSVSFSTYRRVFNEKFDFKIKVF